MKISATSALVLNWTDPHIWKTGKARNYFNELDLSEGDELFEQFSERENYMHLQSVSNRKYFIRKKCVEFLSLYPQGQILFFAAGISPMSVEVAELFPESLIFDIDKYLMNEKKSFINNEIKNIKFLECDITDLKILSDQLNSNDFSKVKKTLAVFEGITYYLRTPDLKNLFKFCKSIDADITGDFGLIPELVESHNREFGVEVFDKIKTFVNLEYVNFYHPDEFKKIILDSGYTNFQRTKFNNIQQERTGSETPFIGNEPGWICMFTAN